MRIEECCVYRGPHLYSRTPMVRVQVDLGALEAWPTDRLDGFTDALLAALPGLDQHHCCHGEPGGFVRRLREGTWLGHVAEHVAIELQTLGGTPVTRGKTRSAKGREGVYHVLFAYQDEAVGLSAGRLAFELVDSLLPERLRGLEGLDQIAPAVAGPLDLEARLKGLRGLAVRHALGPTTRALADAARSRGIPVARVGEDSFLRLGWGSRQKRLGASITSDTSCLAVDAAGDKSLTKHLLEEAGLPTPRGGVARTAEAAMALADGIDGPVVTKPLDGNHGRGVSVGLKTAAEVKRGFEAAARHGPAVIVEEQYVGADYRVLLIGGRLTAVAERRPPEVTGDGRRSVRALIEALNADPRRGDGHEKVMSRVKLDEALDAMLAGQGLDLDAVPAKGRRVVLAGTANLSTGGSAIDRTDVIHPDNRAICERAAAVVGLDVCGVDFLCPDISRSVRETGGGIVEVNAAPGLRMHLHPSEGRARDVCKPIVDRLFASGEDGRIPLISITGTNGKSTTVRMVAHMLRRQGLNVGFTTTSGVYRNQTLLLEADASGPISARMLLADPTVDAAVLETARGGVVREGLGYDLASVGAVLNISNDHIGLGPVQDLDDLAAVKSVVAECVRPDGWTVLNADDPLTVRMQAIAGGRVAWFTLQSEAGMSGFLHKHLAEGGVVAGLEPSGQGAMLVLRRGTLTVPLCDVADVPATLNGAADFNVANALAAAAIGFVHGLQPLAIAEALKTFATDFEHNPGRLNIYDGHGFRVIMDYAHNPAALAAIGRLVARLRPDYGRVVGSVSMPGDRRDEDLREMGALSAEIFDHVVFRERPDGRGRPEGEALRLMAEGALAAGMPSERIDAILAEDEAMDLTLRLARPGDLAVLMPTNPEPVWKQILAFKPAPERSGEAGETARAAHG